MERGTPRDQRAPDALEAAEAALFTDPAKRIIASTARLLLGRAEYVYAYHREDGGWPSVKVDREIINTAIDLMDGAELSDICPSGTRMLAVRIGRSVWYVHTIHHTRAA